MGTSASAGRFYSIVDYHTTWLLEQLSRHKPGDATSSAVSTPEMEEIFTFLPPQKVLRKWETTLIGLQVYIY